MPTEELGSAFSEDFGRPIKELYSICELMLLAEPGPSTTRPMRGASTAPSNLPRDHQSLCPRTVDNYRRIVRESENAQGIFETVTTELVREPGICIKKQRLDPTYLLSNMAKFGDFGSLE